MSTAASRANFGQFTAWELRKVRLRTQSKYTFKLASPGIESASAAHDVLGIKELLLETSRPFFVVILLFDVPRSDSIRRVENCTGTPERRQKRRL